MVEYLKILDKKLLLAINGKHSPFWDYFMETCTDKYFWFPFYFLLLAFLVWKFKHRSILLFICIALLITTADQFASTLLKPMVGRLRPCHDNSINHLLHLVKGCGGTYGFVSSHAANSFAIAGFLSLILKNIRWSVALFVWAFAVSYSRIYLGAHFPGDVIAGGLAGIVFAIGYYKLFTLLSIKFFKNTEQNQLSG